MLNIKELMDKAEVIMTNNLAVSVMYKKQFYSNEKTRLAVSLTYEFL